MKKPRTYKQLRNDPRVSDWSDERDMDEGGLWIYLAPGWVTRGIVFRQLLKTRSQTVVTK